MKKAFAVILLLALVLAGCANQNHTDPTGTEASQSKSNPTFSTEVTEVTERTDVDPTEETLVSAETEATIGKDHSSDNVETTQKPTNPSVTKPDSIKPQGNEDQQQTDPPQETGTVPTTPAPTDPVPPAQNETVPTEPEATEPGTEVTEPESETTTPPAMEEAVCKHEWKCIHHGEEGHWRAGIICDCGWTVYGNPSELTSLWNVHSASFPPAESLFDHGGFGSMDEWIVDKPAYDEWVCRHCGEPKE